MIVELTNLDRRTEYPIDGGFGIVTDSSVYFQHKCTTSLSMGGEYVKNLIIYYLY